MGFTPMMATELEFFLFEKSFDDYRKSGFRDLRRSAAYNADYAIQQTTKEEYVMRPIRNLLVEAGVPVENSKGEAEPARKSSTSAMPMRCWRQTITRWPSRRSRRSPCSMAIRPRSCPSGTTTRWAVRRTFTSR
jgi:hypothetical protein